MKLLWGEASPADIDKATAELVQRLRQNPEALQLLNDILGVWLDSGAKEDFDQYISNLMLEVDLEEDTVSSDIANWYLPVTQGFLH
jgi:hypothetical protein